MTGLSTTEPSQYFDTEGHNSTVHKDFSGYINITRYVLNS